jgi:homocitrate synthase NifV
MSDRARPIALRDSTLREGMDVPGVSFSLGQRLRIAEALALAGVSEAEVVAPSRVREDVRVAREIRARQIPIRLSALVYANRPGWGRDLELTFEDLDRVDLLMPLSEHREPYEARQKAERLEVALGDCKAASLEIGAGLPHATQADPGFVVDIAIRATRAGAKRITFYDTNGGADPFAVRELVRRVVSAVSVPIFFHAHDDLGLATANAWAAILGGAAGLDVTVNGLGDRAGNASLEQLVVLLRLRGLATGVDPAALKGLSRLVEDLSGVSVSVLSPVVGRYAFEHKSPAHREAPAQFEAFSPRVIGAERQLPPEETGRPASAPG